MKNNIQILELGYKNILSVGNNMIVINFKDKHNIFVTGKNGSGKSTLLSALSYNLYGKLDRGITKDQIINNINKSDLYTYCELMINNKHYRIERGIKPDLLKVKVDGIYIDETASKLDMDKKIVELLGCDYNIFYKLVAVSKTNYKPILNMGLTERRTFIESILDIDILTKIQSYIKEEVKQEKTDILLKDKEIENKNILLNREVTRLNESIDNNIKTLETLKQQKQQLLATIPLKEQEKDNDIKILQNKIYELNNKDLSIEKQQLSYTIKQLEQNIFDKEQEKNSIIIFDNINDIKSKKDNIEREINTINKDMIELSTDIKYIIQEGKNIKKQLDNINNNLSCPTCKQTLHNDDLKKELEHKREKELEKYNTKNDIYKSHKHKLDSLIVCAKELSDLVKAHDTSIQQRNLMDNDINQLKMQLNTTINKLNIIDGDKITQIKILEEKLNNIKDKDYLYEINLKVKNIEERIFDIQKEKFLDTHDFINNTKVDINELETELKVLKTELKYKNYLVKILNDDAIKATIVDIYIPFLNDRINFYLDKFGMFTYIQIDKNFKEVLKRNFRHDCSYNNLSEGEKQRVDLSIMFAFRDIAKTKNYANFNVLFLDDMTGHMDDEGIDNISTLIETWDSNSLTIMINHDNQKYVGIFDEILTFYKKNNFTQLQ